MLTLEQKQAICEEYKDRSISTTVIANKYGITRGDVAHIAVEMGAEPRTKKYAAGLKKGKRVCPKCRKTVDVKGAKFCYFCGADMRSNKELLIERIIKAMPTIQLMPTTARDNMQSLLLDIKAELGKG